MVNDIISALISVAIGLLVAFPLGGQLKKRPWAFYLVALALVIAHMAYRFTGTYIKGMQVLVDPMQKGLLAYVFLTIVMFCGAFDEGSAIRRRLQPIRAELSILSFILMLSHVAVFLPPYLPRFASILSSHTAVGISLLIATILTIIYALLSLMSLHVIRARMRYKPWKRVQRLAYLMVALLYAHILLTVGRSALTAHTAAPRVAFALYSLVTLVYVVARLAKLARDRSRKLASHTDGATTASAA